jgi:hypothetical protein
MKEAGFPLRSRAMGGGTLFARIRAVTFAAAALIASSSGYSGCLLGTRIVDDDADLRPLQPPVIIDSTIDGRHLPPGSMLVVDETVNPTPNDRHMLFDVTLVTDSRSDLIAKWFVDRQRPCDSRVTCGQLSGPNPIPAPTANDMSNERHTSQEIDIAPHHCSVVDVFISSAFKQLQSDLHEPVRVGDIGFARWFVVRVDPARQLTDPISFVDCVREQ